MLQDAHVSFLLTQHALLARLPSAQTHVLCLDSDWPAIAEQSRENLSCPLSPEQPAYLVYTSGSTGVPKGIVLRHSSLCNRLLWGQQAHPLTPQDRVLQEASFSFDFAIWEIFAPLLVGARVILARPGGQRDVEYLIDLIAQQRITIAHLIPSLLRVFLEQADLEERCASLRQVYAGAEPLPHSLWQRFSERLEAQLHNVYGPTEASIDTTCWTCEPESAEPMMLIGRPVGHAQVYLLDTFAQPVPLGVAGEIYIGGAGLARGYLNHPELTAERFLPHPWSKEAGARLYRTGDVARYRADGLLEYRGRIDTQVKVRGFRIELGEIEAALKLYAGVDEAVVAVDETEGEKRLVAYLVTQQENQPTVSELRHFLQQRLPDYMLPGWFVWLEKLPLSANGKVDRQHLPALQGERPELQGTYVAPETETERALAEVWSQVLRVEQVGIHDNFYELGGNSLLCIHISACAYQKGIRVSINHILKYQTIAELAKVVDDVASIIEAEQTSVTGEVPFTGGQSWLLEELQAPIPRYWNIVFLFDVQQTLDPAVIQQAMQYLLLHHDILRLHIVQETAGWRQFITDPGETLPLVWKDLSRQPGSERDNIITATAAELQAKINQLNGPLLRVAYIDTGTQGPGCLLWIINHFSFTSDDNEVIFSQHLPVLSGDVLEPDLSVDFYGMEATTSPAQLALKTLEEALLKVAVEHRLLRGDLMIIDNKAAVHARTSFKPRYDGQDRWLQRLFVVQDFRRSRASRPRGSHTCTSLSIEFFHEDLGK